MRVFAEAMRKALKAQISRNPDLEIATEMAPKITEKDVAQNTTASVKSAAFADVKLGDGVMVTPTPITAGEEVQVWYGGLLAKSGADSIILHYGIGPGSWQNVHDVQMAKVSQGVYTCVVRAAEGGGRFEFCFRDNAGNWDNNSGKNWSFTIHNGQFH